jgi:hypothetical protein
MSSTISTVGFVGVVNLTDADHTQRSTAERDRVAWSPQRGAGRERRRVDRCAVCPSKLECQCECHPVSFLGAGRPVEDNRTLAYAALDDSERPVSFGY